MDLHPLGLSNPTSNCSGTPLPSLLHLASPQNPEAKRIKKDLQAAVGPGPGQQLPRREPGSGWSLAYSTGASHSQNPMCAWGYPRMLKWPSPHRRHLTGHHEEAGKGHCWWDANRQFLLLVVPPLPGTRPSRTAGTAVRPVLCHLTQKPRPDSVQQ